MTLDFNNIATRNITGDNTSPVKNDDYSELLFEEGTTVTGTVSDLSADKVSVTFGDNGNSREIAFKKEDIKGAYVGEKRKFKVLCTANDKIMLKDLGSISSSDGKVKFTGVDNAQTALIKSFNDTMGIGEQEDKTPDALKSVYERMSEDDEAGFFDEGLSVKEYLGEQLEKALERVKLSLMIKQEYCKAKGEDIKEDRENIVSMRGNDAITGADKRIVAELKERDLPVTPEVCASISSAMNIAATIACQGSSAQDYTMASAAKMYMISTSLAPTIDNIYKSSYSSFAIKGEKISDSDFNELLPQIEKEISKTNNEYNITVSDARELLESGLPVTAETLTQKAQLEHLDLSEGTVLTRIADTVLFGDAPMNTLLVGDISIHGKTSITRKDLAGIFDFADDDAPAKEAFFETTFTSAIDMVTSKRRLEEIRLTAIMSGRAISNALSGEAETSGLITEIESNIEKLKNIEHEYYSKCFDEVGGTSTEENLSELTTIVERFNELREAPASVLGATLVRRYDISVDELVQEGKPLAETFARLNETYEAVGTQIRGDLGDNIEKAFVNVDELLSLNGFELTTANRRAARILGYNRMELSKDNMDAVKAYDSLVGDLITYMKPVVAAELVRRGINPLDMPLPELNELLHEIAEEKGPSREERFANYLVELDRKDTLTEEERSAYIGIYRLIDKLTKDGGAEIGDCINRGVALTLGNLLGSYRTSRSQRIDAKISDSFGGTKDIITHGVSISDQILACITPDRIDYPSCLESSPDKFLDSLLEKEQFTENLARNSEQDLVENISSASKALTETDFLTTFGEPATLSNIMTMQEFVARPLIFKQLDELFDSKDKFAEDILSEASEDSIDGLNESYTEMLDKNAELIREELESNTITSAGALSLNLLGAHINLLGSLSKHNFYEMPVRTSSGNVQMNLTLLQGALDDTGRIDIRFRTEHPVTISVKVSGSSIDGLITTEDNSVRENIRSAIAELTGLFEDKGFSRVNIFDSVGSISDAAYISQLSADYASAEEKQKTSALFGIAKSFAETVGRKL